ncbi:hypothetical protein CTAYLR_001208 [Chrysophaeum taylorii]|uniref:Pyrroline-5-carboxylate reductase n=1 Tax=Chrysophaeum taylorii TaxID=2483200 RepID=A0AAD7XK73_9STRA|nr:hypothetical protein CTAYLR_001208 [Chrysophaeum taylorii]
MVAPPQALVGKSIGFIGAGAMATAMMHGLLRSGVLTESLCASDPFIGSREKTKKMGVTVTESNAEVARKSDVIVLAVKPNVIGFALESIVGELKEQLIVSIAAGVTIGAMSAHLETATATRIVRTMPNTPCLVGEGAIGISRGPRVTDADVAVAKALFSGVCVEVYEKDLNAVNALSGSGPAYVLLFIEALADAGVRAGLTRQVAMQLAAQTVKGTAAMQMETGSHPGVLKDQVCSPGGTTIAAVEALEKNGFRYAAMSAVAACKQRADEMTALAAAAAAGKK